MSLPTNSLIMKEEKPYRAGESHDAHASAGPILSNGIWIENVCECLSEAIKR